MSYDFSNFSFRSHYMGELMTAPKGKSIKQKYDDACYYYDKNINVWKESKNKETKTAKEALEKANNYNKKANELEPYIDTPNLSEKAKDRLAQIYTEVTTGRIKNIQSFYTEKGLHTEEAAITQYSLYKNQMYRKNKIRENNGFINGEMDFEEDDDTSVDNKSSWDPFTFDRTAVKKIDPNYYWQGQCYMWLFNKKRHKVLFSLIDTPDWIYNRLKDKLKYEVPASDLEDAEKDLYKLHRFNDLPVERKVRPYTILRSDDDISRMKIQIPVFRDFLNNFDKNKFLDDEQDD